MDLEALSDIPVLEPQGSNSNMRDASGLKFRPYANESSFHLGNWYWSSGVQKTKANFRKLIAIITHPSFKASDVRDTKWDQIDKELVGNGSEKRDLGPDRDSTGEWLDEGAGWKKTPINIQVPFHQRAKNPGPKEFNVGHLYHRSLVDVIKEKVSDPHQDKDFHYEPFELYWQPNEKGPEIRVHGEVYTSPAFVKAHEELQDSVGEPDCQLPKVIAVMMFWSDATHLTSFGTAKLWPCYLFFGNESKYCRCKPSCNLCSHVTYFQTVSVSSLQPSLSLMHCTAS